MRWHIWHPLLWMLMLVNAVAIVLISLHGRYERAFDNVMLVIIFTAYGLACLSMLTRTRWLAWSALGAGLVATMAGDAGLYGWIFASRHWRDAVVPHQDVILSYVRALLGVGGCFVVIGLAREWWQDRRRPTEHPP